MSEKFNVHQELIDLWVRQAIYFDGDFKVSNSGRSYLSVVKGKAVLCEHGYLKGYRKKPEVLRTILHKLVDRYHNFIHRGYYYYYDRGEWYRHEVAPE